MMTQLGTTTAKQSHDNGEVLSGSQPLVMTDAESVLRFLLITAAALTVLSIAASVWIHYQGLRLNRTVISLFVLDDEDNFPTWYSTLLLAFCAALLHVISAVKRIQGDRFAKQWFGLAGIFTLLSIDELASIHERAGMAIAKLAPAGVAVPNYAWVALAVPLLIAVGLAYLKFLAGMPRKFGREAVIAGCVYVSGAILLEILSVSYWHAHGYDFAYYSIANTEELLEMVGASLFAYALLRYMGDSGMRAQFTFPSAK